MKPWWVMRAPAVRVLPTDVMRWIGELKVNGWLSLNEGMGLYEAAQLAREGVIVEIGSWQGLSTLWLYGGSTAGEQGLVFAIDHGKGSPEHAGDGPHWNYPILIATLARAAALGPVIPVPLGSEEAEQSFPFPVSLLFLDGAHDRESVRRDVTLWGRRLNRGSYLLMHDCHFDGVAQVIDMIKAARSFDDYTERDNLFSARKCVEGNVLKKNKWNA